MGHDSTLSVPTACLGGLPAPILAVLGSNLPYIVKGRPVHVTRGLVGRLSLESLEIGPFGGPF